MAQKTIIQLVDDMTGAEIGDGEGETVSYALDGQNYTIDLTSKNADKFRGLFMDYVAVSTKVGSRKLGGSRSTKSATGPSAREIREWARSNNLDVPERGRIPESVRAAFESAN